MDRRHTEEEADSRQTEEEAERAGGRGCVTDWAQLRRHVSLRLLLGSAPQRMMDAGRVFMRWH